MARKYKRVDAVPCAQFTTQSLTMLSFIGTTSAEECTAIVKAIASAFKACRARDFDGELPEPPSELSEAGREVYDALMNDMLAGVNGYWEACNARSPKPPPDSGGGLSHTQGDYIKSECEGEREDIEKNIYFTNTVSGVSPENAQYRIQAAGIEVDNGLRGYIRNLGNSLTDEKLSRAIEYCICHGMTESRAFTGTLRNIIEQDGWRE